MITKVVHISTVHHPYDTRIYHKECKSLVKAGFDVSLIVTDHPDLQNEKDHIKIVKVDKINNRLLRMVKGSYIAYKLAKKIKAQVYHFHDPELIFVGLLLKNKKNIVIYDVHEDYETSIKQKNYLAKPIRQFLAKLFRFIEKMCAKKFNICIAEKYYKDRFPNGIEILNYPLIENKQQNEQINQDSIQNCEGTNLIYTGNVTEDRGALIHSKLVLLKPNINVFFYGKCNEILAERLYNIVGNQNSSRLIINGINTFIKREEIDNAYKEGKWVAGLALFPKTDHYLKKELTKFFEYMYAGLPIICSNFPLWKEFVEKYKCGIAVDIDNENEILNAIEFMKNNPEIAKDMGQNGRNAIIKELNWDTQEVKLVNWYRQLLTDI